MQVHTRKGRSRFQHHEIEHKENTNKPRKKVEAPLGQETSCVFLARKVEELEAADFRAAQCTSFSGQNAAQHHFVHLGCCRGKAHASATLQQASLTRQEKKD